MSRAQQRYEDLCFAVGRDSQLYPEAEILKRYPSITRGFARYWAQKYADPNFHDGQWGGARNNKFTEEAEAIVEAVLFTLVQENSFQTTVQYVQDLQALGIN